MKKLSVLFVSLLVLTPTLAAAQAPERPTRAEVRAHLQTNASSTPGSLPKLGPAIRQAASSSRALGSTTVESVRARVAAIKNLMAHKREAMHQRALEARQKAKERFGERVEQHVERISNRLASTSAHISAIADRLDTRIDELEDQGFDMSESIALLAEARASISVVDDRILAVNEALDAAMSTTTPKLHLPAVRAAVKEAQDALGAAKQDLRKTLQSIKAESATTTSSQ